MVFELPKLPYAFDALTSFIDPVTMETHYTKHHAGYTKKLNAALEKHKGHGHVILGRDLDSLSAEELVALVSHLPEDIIESVKNNGGGYLNHALFWSILSPDKKEIPAKLLEAIKEDLGSMEDFKEMFTSAATGQFGSGWAWLVVSASGELEVISTPNQDSPLMYGKTPILGLDVWEHAYYLHYKNLRGDYVKNFFDVINWEEVSRRYLLATS